MTNPSRKLQPEITKNKITLVLEKLMQEKPIEDITIREICRLAEVSVGTFYVYFSSKEEAILFIYRSADAIFEELNLSDVPLENVRTIMKTFFDMVEYEPLSFIRHMYICHLSYKDEYFLSEERGFFQLLNEQIRQLTHKDSKEIAWELLEYGRGKVYNYCIGHREPEKEWFHQVLDKTMEYFSFLLNSN